MPSLRTLPSDLRLFAKYHLVRRSVTYPAPETELGVVSLDFDLDAYVERLRRPDPRFEVSTLESLSYEGRAHPILRLRSVDTKAKQTLLVLAGVHGNEHAGLLAVPEILDGFDPTAGVRLVVVTPVNPVGAAELSRYNAEGYDINRDFERFLTPEARAIARVYEEERPDFVVSLHEGPQDACFFFANRYVDDGLARRLLTTLERRGTRLATEDYLGLRLRPPGLSPMTRPAWWLNRLWAKALGMKATIMFSDDRGVPEIVLESSWRVPDPRARIRPHVDLVLDLLDALERRTA